jgi:hypothetical protein
MKFTHHFENQVLPKRPYLTKDLLLSIIKNPLKEEIQDNGRIKYWAYSSELINI